MLTRQAVLNYRDTFGAHAAVDLLLLTGPDGFDGSINDYNNLMASLDEEAIYEMAQ